MTNTNDVQQDYANKKKLLEEAFKEFHKLAMSKVLDKNKSTATKNTETAVIDKLVKAVVALENANVGEGILSLSVIAVREQLVMRDRINELEYELCLALKDIKKIKEDLGIKDDKPKT